MNTNDLRAVERKMLTCLSQAEVMELTEKALFIFRLRIVKPIDFILSLIAALSGDGNNTTLADLHRKFNELTGCDITYKAWANQAKKNALPQLILWMWTRCLQAFSSKVLAFDECSPFAEFEHIYIYDGSSQAVYKALEGRFPGRFSKVSSAAVELHTAMDLLNDNVVRIQLTEDTRSERACLPKLANSMALTLGLYDAGYFDIEYFTRIDDRVGCFICKAPQSINPSIISAMREDGKTYHRYIGLSLKDTLSSIPKDQCMDLTVEWPRYKGWAFRLIVRWNGRKQKWVFIVTNLNREQFSLCDILQAYRLRWQIELLFKKLKSYTGWYRFNTKSDALMISLIILSFLTVTLKRYLAYAAQSTLVHEGLEEEISTHKAMKSGTHLFGNLILAMVAGHQSLRSEIKALLKFWDSNAKREHAAQDGCSGRPRLGLCALGGA